MEPSLRILAADGDPAVCQFYQESLSAWGHQVCAVTTGRLLIEQYFSLRPDLVITEASLPELEGLAAAREICRQAPVPVIAVFDRYDPEAVPRTLDNPHILACLIKPPREGELAIAITLAVRRFRQFQACREKAAALREALEERKLVERAKGLIAEFCGLGEQAAHRSLQRLASVRNERLAEVARNLVAAGDVFLQLQQLQQSNTDGKLCNQSLSKVLVRHPSPARAASTPGNDEMNKRRP
jgi:response regulator NasT